MQLSKRRWFIILRHLSSQMHHQQSEEMWAQSKRNFMLISFVERTGKRSLKNWLVLRFQWGSRNHHHLNSIQLNEIQNEIFDIILGTVNTRWSASIAFEVSLGILAINCRSFEDVLTNEPTFPSGHQSCHIIFVDIVWGGLTSTPGNSIKEVTSPIHHAASLHYMESTKFHAAMQEFCKLWESKISKMKDGYSSLAGLIFNPGLKTFMSMWKIDGSPKGRPSN